MSKKDLISELANKGLLDDETINSLNDAFCVELEKDIEKYKSISMKSILI